MTRPIDRPRAVLAAILGDPALVLQVALVSGAAGPGPAHHSRSPSIHSNDPGAGPARPGGQRALESNPGTFSGCQAGAAALDSLSIGGFTRSQRSKSNL